MTSTPHWFDPICLASGELINRFKMGEFSDKSFSVLYARWLGIPAPSGFVLELRNKRVIRNYCIAPGIEDFLASHDLYLIRYDFRGDFDELEKWMKEKRMRPNAILCQRDDVIDQIERSIEIGKAYSDTFFIIVTERFPFYKHVMSSMSESYTYIECSDDSDATHGCRDTKLCVLRGEDRIIDDTGFSDDLVKLIYDVTKQMSSVIGGNLICEFNIYQNILYLSTAQRSGKMKTVFGPYIEKDLKIISVGPLRGIIKRINENEKSVRDIVTELSETGRRYVFLAEKPYSEFVDLLPFADGFIFDEGSMLCHLAVLLREKEIPARIIRGSTEKYKEADRVFII